MRIDCLRRCVTVALFLAAVPAVALEEYYSIAKSVRALGMGGSFYAISDDQYALFYNPAGLSKYAYPESQIMFGVGGQFAPQTLSALGTLTASGRTASTIVTSLESFTGKPLYAGVSVMPFYVRKNFALSLLLADAKTSVAILGRQLDSEVDLTVISDSGLVAGYGFEIPKTGLHFGATLKTLLRAGGRKRFTLLEIAQSNAFSLTPQQLGGIGFGVDADVGAIYELKNLAWGRNNRVALSVSNLLASSFSFARQFGAPPGLPRYVSLGYATELPGWEWIDSFLLSLDLAEFQLGGNNSQADLGGRVGSFLKHINIGAEMPLEPWFAVRLGIRQGYPTAGLGFNFKAMKADFAYYSEEVSAQPGLLGSSRFALNLTFGFGSPPPVPPRPKLPEGAPEVEGVPIKIPPKGKKAPLPEGLDLEDLKTESPVETITIQKGQP